MTNKGNSKTTQRKVKQKKPSTSAANRKKFVAEPVENHVKNTPKIEQKLLKQSDVSPVKEKQSKSLKKGVKRKVEDPHANDSNVAVSQLRMSQKVGCRHLEKYKEHNPD